MSKQSTEKDRYLSISEMAGIMGISRQTLIYYDRINLFRPEYVDEKNCYRYYSAAQLPMLRNICFLKSIGIPLKEIQKNNAGPSLSDTMELFRQQLDLTNQKIRTLELQKQEMEKRLHIFEHNMQHEDYPPRIQKLPERTFLCYPYGENDFSPEGIHRVLQKVWNRAGDYGLLPPRRWGTLFLKDQVLSGTPSRQAAICCQLETPIPDCPYNVSLPAGEYACMARFGMPYKTGTLEQLLEWVRNHDYEIVGDIYDECLDAAFYDRNEALDFSEIQIPVRRKIQND